MMFANVLAIFLTIVVVGGGVVGLYDALERMYLAWQQAPAAPTRREAPRTLVHPRGATPVVARGPIH
jgi:hypothetical protein